MSMSNRCPQSMSHVLRSMALSPSMSHKQSYTKCKSYIDLLKIFLFAISGREIGKYLALDLGGTNFRVLLLGVKANPLI